MTRPLKPRQFAYHANDAQSPCISHAVRGVPSHLRSVMRGVQSDWQGHILQHEKPVMRMHESVWGTKRRAFARVLVRVGTEEPAPYHADINTGTLYEIGTGRCLTSERMRLV